MPLWLRSTLGAKPNASVPSLHKLGEWDRGELREPLDINNTMTAGVLSATLKRAGILDSIGSNLKNDIDTVLELYQTGEQETGGQKALAVAADKEFRIAYAPLFKKNDFATFRNPLFRNLMRALAADLVASSAESPARALVAYPGFKPDASQRAYERILSDYLNKFVSVPRSADQAGTASAPIDPASVPLPDSPRMTTDTTLASEAKAPPSLEEEQRAARRIGAEVHALQPGNQKFRRWLAENGIEAASNSGSNLNCFIIALLQHATGAYESAFEPHLAARAAQLRESLGIAPGMLYPDDETAFRIVQTINTQYRTDMVLVEVQADQSGQAFIPGSLDQIMEGEGSRVVIWQQGNHFEALYAKASQPASS